MPLFKPPDYDLDKRISHLLEAINKLTLNIDKINTKHEFLTENQDELAKKVDNNMDIINKKVDKNSDEIGSLQTSTAKIDTVSNLAKYGGLALVSAIVVSWNTLSGRVDTTTAKTEANAQSIVQLKSDSDDTQKQLSDMQKRITDNREAILSAVRDAKNRGDLK